MDDGFSSGYVINGGDPITDTIFASNHAPAGDAGQSTDQQLLISMATSEGVVTPPDLPAPGVLLATLHITLPPNSPFGNYPLIIDGTGSAGLPALDFAASYGETLYNSNVFLMPEPPSIVFGLMAAASFALVALRRRRAA